MLHLSDCGLTSLPEMIGFAFFPCFLLFFPHPPHCLSVFAASFVNVTELDLSWNKLTALPAWVEKIKRVHVAHNNFTSLPVWFWTQVVGEILDVSGNPLDSGSILTIASLIKGNTTLQTVKFVSSLILPLVSNQPLIDKMQTHWNPS